MKTAISIPDDTFDRAQRRADALGMSCSELFTRAAVRYLDAASITSQIDAAVDLQPDLDSSAEDTVAAGHRVLDDTAEDW